MKIAILHQDLFFQGGQKVAAKLANGLAERGHSVDVVVSKVHEDILKSSPETKPFKLLEQVGLHVLPNRRSVHNVFALARLLMRLKPDVIVPNVGHYNACAVAAKLLTRQKIPIVYVEHCDVGREPPSRATMGFLLRRWILSRDAMIVAVCNRMRLGLVRRYGLPDHKVRCVYNPIFDDGQVAGGARCLHPRLVGDKPYTVVAAGALHKLKNFELVIDAFARFHEKVKDSQLLIFGRGPMEGELNRKISGYNLQGRVVLAGFTEYLWDNLKNADLFVSGSNLETFGIVIVEALDAGCSVIAADCPIGPGEILQNGKLGQLVPMNDAESMSNAMMRAYLGQYKPTAAFERHEYELSYVLDQYEKLLREVTGK